MRGPSSLSNRIFLACTVLSTLSLGFAFYYVNARASVEAEAELRRGLTDAATLFDARRTTLTDTYTRLAKLVADLPKLHAAVETGDAPTVQPLAEDYRQLMAADLLVVSDPRGNALGVAGADFASLPLETRYTAQRGEISTFVPHARGVLQIVSVPIFGLPTELLGRLTVGFFLDDRLAEQFKRLTGSEIAFAAQRRIVAASLPADLRGPLESVIDARDIASVTLGGNDYLALAKPLSVDASHGPGQPRALVLRSRTERLRFLNTVRTGLVGALIVTVLLATILSYGVARTMTRPLAAITGAMREVAATGDLTRRVAVRSRAWDDEAARLLATAFNTLTESIAKFQREEAQKERLSSLGRLSTVIAHEVRNPLMIIRATLATLRRDNIRPTELREAVADIDEETRRLNRVVSDVLDFARPIRFELAEANLNDICRTSAAAAWAGHSDDAIQFDLDPELPSVVTDAERLRTALVNIVTNARHAVEAAWPEPHADIMGTAPASGNGRHHDGGVIVRTRHQGNRVTVTVEDHGIGIAEEDMAHIFDPYFTTRRAGTGLGLPISKSIIERLGGTIAVHSQLGRGTEIRIGLPLAAPEAGA
jgi:signal transduction histidine kinase